MTSLAKMAIIVIFYKMGGSDSKEEEKQVNINPDPLIQRLRKTMRLAQNEETGATYAFMNHKFLNQITKNKDGRMSLDYSPFCSILLTDKKDRTITLVTCTLASPIMAVAPMIKLADPSGFLLTQKLSCQGVFGGKNIKRKINKIILVKEGNIVLLFLEAPIWEVGWCGVTYLVEEDDISNMPFQSIFNIFAENQKQVTQQAQEEPIISQKIQKIYCRQSSPFEGKSSKLGTNLLIKFIDRKPYLVGVHKQEHCNFFTKELLKTMQVKTAEYVKPAMQRQFLKQIDIEKIQMQSTW